MVLKVKDMGYSPGETEMIRFCFLFIFANESNPETGFK